MCCLHNCIDIYNLYIYIIRCTYLYPPTPADSKGEGAREKEPPVRHFFGAICWFLCPSLPWCFRLAGPVLWPMEDTTSPSFLSSYVPTLLSFPCMSSQYSTVNGQHQQHHHHHHHLHCHCVSGWWVQRLGSPGRKVSVEAPVWHMSGYCSIGSKIGTLGTFLVWFGGFCPSLPWCFRLASPAFGPPGRCKLKHMSGTMLLQAGESSFWAALMSVEARVWYMSGYYSIVFQKTR